MYGKFLLTRPDEFSGINLAIILKSLIALLAFGNKVYLYFLHATTGARHYPQGAAVQDRYENAYQIEILSITTCFYNWD